jgi:ketosteroid isomerase-like protein
MNKTLLALLICSVALFAQNKSSSDAKQQVLDAEKAWIAALTSNDHSSLDKIVAPDLIYTHSTGLVENKADYMKAVSTFQKYKTLEHQNPAVRVYGDAAVVSSTAHMTGSTRGTPFDNTLRLIHVWVKQGGKWQLAAHQTTRIAQ